MRFWDSSALVPLFVDQPSTAAVRELYRSSDEIVVWRFTEIEIRSALARLEREGALTAADAQRAFDQLGKSRDGWTEIVHADGVQFRAQRLVRVHPLRAADALQLGAALLAAEDRPQGVDLVTLDTRLADAARREGFAVLPG